MTDSLSASPSWYQAPTWDPRPVFPYSFFDSFFFASLVLLMWGTLTEEKSGLYFSAFAGHHQHKISQI
jgi:hypothetical protein